MKQGSQYKFYTKIVYFVFDIKITLIYIEGMEEKILRNYEIRKSTQAWLETIAKREGRSVIRQVEKLLEDARAKDERK